MAPTRAFTPPPRFCQAPIALPRGTAMSCVCRSAHTACDRPRQVPQAPRGRAGRRTQNLAPRPSPVHPGQDWCGWCLSLLPLSQSKRKHRVLKSLRAPGPVGARPGAERPLPRPLFAPASALGERGVPAACRALCWKPSLAPSSVQH